MNRRLEIDGLVYELTPVSRREQMAAYLDIHIERDGKRVALFSLRCAASEPQYEMVERMPIDEQMALAVRRGGLETLVRSALEWQSSLGRINPGWGVSPIFQPWFPENYRDAVQLCSRYKRLQPTLGNPRGG
jgi:hypothetical protein